MDVTDEELEALALSSDPDGPLPVDAEPLPLVGLAATPLPGWYMPPAAAGATTSTVRRRLVVWSLIGAFCAINAVGMCSTYGVVGFG